MTRSAPPEERASCRREADSELPPLRAALIEEVKKKIDAWRTQLLEEKEGKAPTAESLDVCTLAYLHQVLMHDEGAAAREAKHGTRSSIVIAPLHEAIRRAQAEEKHVVEDFLVSLQVVDS